MPILPVDPLVADPAAAQAVQAFVAAFNAAFDVMVSFAVYLLPVVAAIRLAQRS